MHSPRIRWSVLLAGVLPFTVAPACSVFLGFDARDYAPVEGSPGGSGGTSGAGDGDGDGFGGGGAADSGGGGAGATTGGNGPTEVPPPIHHYPLDEESGVQVEDIVGNATGQAGSLDDWTEGLVGTGCYSLEGTDPFLEFPQSIAGTDDFTVSFWFNRTSEATRSIVHKQGNFDEGGFVLLHENENLKLEIGGDGMTRMALIAAPALPPLGDGEWVHIALTLNSKVNRTARDLLILWVNGENVAQTEEIFTGASPANSGSKLRFGDVPSYKHEGAHGLIDDIQIFDVALSAEEMKTLYEEVF